MSSASSGLGQIDLSQAKCMLRKSNKHIYCKQMHSEISNQNWWGVASKNGKSQVAVGNDNKVAADLVTEVDDDRTSVRAPVQDFKAIIHEVDEEAWIPEERRRTEQATSYTRRKRL